MKKKYIIRASEVIEYVAEYTQTDVIPSLEEAKSMFSRQVSEVTWYDHAKIKASYSGFQWDICEEVSDDESGSRKPKKKR
tara:strand:+ start:315 stop:554 length:240 start_codon:yes stop_codon:yes gene_type:complete